MSRLRAVLRTGGFLGWSAGNLAVYEAHRLLVSDEARPSLLASYRVRFTRGVLHFFGTELLVHGSLDLDRGAFDHAILYSALYIGVMRARSGGVLVIRYPGGET